MTVLTERRQADRAELAGQVAELAGRYGLSADVVDLEAGHRRTHVALAGPHGLGVWVTFDGRSPHPHPDTYVLSWHGVAAGWRLAAGKGWDVNRFHGHKATDVVHGSAALLLMLENRFAGIADGSAFVHQEG